MDEECIETEFDKAFELGKAVGRGEVFKEMAALYKRQVTGLMKKGYSRKEAVIFLAEIEKFGEDSEKDGTTK